MVLLCALALFPSCSCCDETRLLFLEQQLPSVLPSSAESHYRNPETAPAPAVHAVCMFGDNCCPSWNDRFGVVFYELNLHCA